MKLYRKLVMYFNIFNNNFSRFFLLTFIYVFRSGLRIFLIELCHLYSCINLQTMEVFIKNIIIAKIYVIILIFFIANNYQNGIKI